MPVYKTHLFLPIFVSKSGCFLNMLLKYFKSKMPLKSREMDPKRQYFQHPVYCNVMAKIITKGSVISVYVKLAHCKKTSHISFVFCNFT